MSKLEEGYFFHHDFKEQLRVLDPNSKIMQVLDAASDYVLGKTPEIENEMAKVTFLSWKSKLDKEILDEEKRCQRNSRNWEKAKLAIKAKKKKNETFLKCEEVQNVEAEKIEKFPFEEFWNAFGNKKNRQKAESIWRMMPETDKALAMDGIPKYIAFVEDGAIRQGLTNLRRYQMLPTTYLLGKRWEDDYSITENNAAHGTDRSNYKSIKEQEFERNVAVLKDTMAMAERGEYADLDPFNAPAKEYWEIQRDMANGGTT